MEYFYFVLLGVSTGFLSSVLGLGGGLVIVAVLPTFLPISQHQAIATSLCIILFVAITNTIKYSRRGQVEWQVVRPIAIFSGLFAFVAGMFASSLSETVLIVATLLLMVVVALRLILFNIDKQKVAVTNSYVFAKSAGVGSLSGLISGFTGVGGGMISIPLMMILGLVENLKLSAASNAVMIVTSLFGVVSYAFFSADVGMFQIVRIDAALTIYLTALIVIPFGIKLNSHVSLRARKFILFAILLGVAAEFLVRLNT